MYSNLDVYFEGHLSEVFDRFPQGDGFGVLEAIRKRLRTRSEALERLVKREWDDLQMDKGFPKGHCNFLEFKKKSLDIVRRYNDVRVPDADGIFTKLGTTKEWRHNSRSTSLCALQESTRLDSAGGESGGATHLPGV